MSYSENAVHYFVNKNMMVRGFFHSLKYLRSATFGSKDIVIRKLEIVAKTQFLYSYLFIRSKLDELRGCTVVSHVDLTVQSIFQKAVTFDHNLTH